MERIAGEYQTESYKVELARAEPALAARVLNVTKRVQSGIANEVHQKLRSVWLEFPAKIVGAFAEAFGYGLEFTNGFLQDCLWTSTIDRPNLRGSRG